MDDQSFCNSNILRRFYCGGVSLACLDLCLEAFNGLADGDINGSHIPVCLPVLKRLVRTLQYLFQRLLCWGHSLMPVQRCIPLPTRIDHSVLRWDVYRSCMWTPSAWGWRQTWTGSHLPVVRNCGTSIITSYSITSFFGAKWFLRIVASCAYVLTEGADREHKSERTS